MVGLSHRTYECLISLARRSRQTIRGIDVTLCSQHLCSTRSPLTDVTTWKSFSRRPLDRSTAGAWCGAQCRAGRAGATAGPRRPAWSIACKKAYQLGFSGRWTGNRSRGVRLPRGLRTGTLAARAARTIASMSCGRAYVFFFVLRRFRGQGIVRRLIAAAVEHAGEKAAAVVEAYPVDPQSPSYRIMGFVPSFEAAGFQEVGAAGTRRHVMRLAL